MEDNVRTYKSDTTFRVRLNGRLHTIYRGVEYIITPDGAPELGGRVISRYPPERMSTALHSKITGESVPGAPAPTEPEQDEEAEQPTRPRSRRRAKAEPDSPLTTGTDGNTD